MRLNGKKLLLVSPRPTTMESLRKIIEKEGGNPFSSRNASYALWFLKSESFHGIVLDAELDEGQWDSLEHQMEKKKEYRKIPLLILADPKSTEELQKLARLKAVGVVSKPINEEDIISILGQKTLKSKPTKSHHDSRIIKCFVAGIRKMIHKTLHNVPQIGKIQLKPEGQLPQYVAITKQFTTLGKNGTLAWTFDTMFISMLAKAWGEENLIAELDPWYLEEFLKKLDHQIHFNTKEFLAALEMNIDFQKPSYLIAPKSPLRHIDKDQTLTVNIHHLGSGCQLEVSMINISDKEPDESHSSEEQPMDIEEALPEASLLDSGVEQNSSETLQESESKPPSELDDILEIE